MEHTKKTDLGQCTKTYFSDWHRCHCSNKAKVIREGKGYCKRHDPVNIAEKRRIKDEIWEKEWAAKKLVWDRDKALGQVAHGLTTEEIKALNPNLIAAAPDLLGGCEATIEKLEIYLGEWVSVGDDHLPKWATPIRRIISELEPAIAKAKGEK